MTEEYTDDILAEMARNIGKVADAITPFISQPGVDATGGHVASLTEAIMGNTAGLKAIADAIESLADAIRDHGTLR